MMSKTRFNPVVKKSVLAVRQAIIQRRKESERGAL